MHRTYHLTTTCLFGLLQALTGCSEAEDTGGSGGQAAASTSHGSSAISVSATTSGQATSSSSGGTGTGDRFVDRVRFVDAAESGVLLGTADDFTQRLSPFDVAARLGDATKTSPGDYLAFASAQARDWNDEQRGTCVEALELVQQRIDALGLTMPEMPGEISFVNSTGAEEGDAGAYTRAGTVVIPACGTGSISQRAGLIAHELFHVLTRHHPELAEDAHAILGFTPVAEIELPAARAALRITNPDAPFLDREIHVTVEGTDTALVPLLLSNGPYVGGNLFSYLDVFLFDPKVDATYAYEEVGGFYEQIGTNTTYNIHPEEISAEHFRLGLAGASVDDPALVEALLDLFR